MLFPADDSWNTPIDTLPLDPQSNTYVNTIGPTDPLFADFGSGIYQGSTVGIPYVIVPGTQAKVPVKFLYDDESDPGPYPIPPGAPIEGGSGSTGDRHVLVLDRDNCKLHEVWSSYPQPDGSWMAGSGAVFDLKSSALRPAGWTSSDAAGLALLPGLVRYDEVAAGEIRHAIRFTVKQTQRKYIWPARHYASSLTDPKYPPMGLRFRLKASFDISGFSAENQVILRALKRYGIILADNGMNWFISGVPDEGWNNDDLHILKNRVRGSDFEAVDTSSLIIDPNSGQARQPQRGPANVVNAASYVAGPVAPGEIVTIFGTNLGPPVGVGARLNASGLVDNFVAEARALFDGVAAPLVYVQANQLSAIVPYSVAGKTSTQLVLEYKGVRSAPATIPVAESAPGIFSAKADGTGQGAILNQDTSRNGPENPADKGSIVVFYATGEGQTNPAGTDGKQAGAILPKPKLAVSVLIGGLQATVMYAGAAPGEVAGLMQINARVPPSVASGSAVPIFVSIGGAGSQPGITLAIR